MTHSIAGRRRQIGLLLAAWSCATACGSTHGAESVPPAEPGAPVRAPHTVRLDAAKIAEITIEEIAAGAPAEALHATGTVEFNADRVAKVLPPVTGQVQEMSLNVGDTVRKGDTLFVLSSREVAAAIADHVAAHKDVDMAEKTYAMNKDLFEHQAVSRIALQTSENDLAKSKGKVLQSEEILRVLGLDIAGLEDPNRVQSRIPIRAPLDGTITERSVTNGQFVGTDMPLLVVADLSSVWVLADVFERDLHSISAGQRADVTTAAYPSDVFSAQVAKIGTVVDPQTRTAKVRFLVANPHQRLKPGMFTSTSLYLPDHGPALTVPGNAVFVENSRSYAYVQTRGEEFTRREVETAPSAASRLRVVRGLSTGDRIVSAGVLLLRQLDTDVAGQ
jgi:cobalt-zinc-cadmium efflux system membrane fusion protein